MKLRVGDFLIASAVLALAAAIWLYPQWREGGGTVAEISQNGIIVQKITLSNQNEQIELAGCLLEVANGEIRMASSNCRDQVCVHTGAISRGGQAIVCAPNRVTVVIRGESDIDAIAG